MVFKQELIQIEKICPQDIWDIEVEIAHFKNKINTSNLLIYESLNRLQDCVLHYRKAKNMLRNFIKPENNKYIDENKIREMDENLNRIDLNLDKLENETIQKIGSIEQLEKKPILDIRIKRLQNLLEEAMDSLIINSLINSALRFKDIQDTKAIKKEIIEKKIKKGDKEFVEKEERLKEIDISKDIFLYNLFLFQEIYPSSFSVGGFVRQEIKSFPKNIVLHNPNPNQFSTKESENQESKDKKEEEIESILKEEELPDGTF